VSCSVWPPSLLEAAFFFCYSSTALAGGYSCVTLTLTLVQSGLFLFLKLPFFFAIAQLPSLADIAV